MHRCINRSPCWDVFSLLPVLSFCGGATAARRLRQAAVVALSNRSFCRKRFSFSERKIPSTLVLCFRRTCWANWCISVMGIVAHSIGRTQEGKNRVNVKSANYQCFCVCPFVLVCDRRVKLVFRSAWFWYADVSIGIYRQKRHVNTKNVHVHLLFALSALTCNVHMYTLLFVTNSCVCKCAKHQLYVLPPRHFIC